MAPQVNEIILMHTAAKLRKMPRIGSPLLTASARVMSREAEAPSVIWPGEIKDGRREIRRFKSPDSKEGRILVDLKKGFEYHSASFILPETMFRRWLSHSS